MTAGVQPNNLVSLLQKKLQNEYNNMDMEICTVIFLLQMFVPCTDILQNELYLLLFNNISEYETATTGYNNTNNLKQNLGKNVF